jgi:hypothetical protein
MNFPGAPGSAQLKTGDATALLSSRFSHIELHFHDGVIDWVAKQIGP